MTHVIEDIETEFIWQRKRLFHKQACEALFDMCQDNPEARITKITTKPKSKWRPVPLDTVVRITVKERVTVIPSGSLLDT